MSLERLAYDDDFGAAAADLIDLCDRCFTDRLDVRVKPLWWLHGEAQYVCPNGHKWMTYWCSNHSGGVS